MASTIQIKNSTTSGNAPSSLTTGELAINVVDGNFFYGSGSAVKQDFAVSTVSASGTIVASNLSGTNTGDQDLSSLATIVQLNASSSTLQTNIDTKVDTTGTPANNQLAIFTDSDTIEGDSDLTWDGSTFTINGTGSVDLLQVDDKLQGNGSGFQFFAFNEDTVKVKFANWYSSNDRQYGMGQLWYETWFAAIDNQAGRDNRRIGFYLEEPDAGSTDSGTPGQHPSNARFYVDINGAYLSGSFTASADISASGTITGNSLVGTVGTATQGTIDHDSLANFVANEHIDHSGVSITAGAGLTGGGTIASTRDIAVGAGTGVTVNADDIAIGQDVATTANVQFANITGSAISASGDITANSFTGTVTTATTASYVQASNVDGTVPNASTASYVAGGNVDGDVASATDATNSTNTFIGNSDGSSAYFVTLAASTGNQPLKRDAGIQYDSSADILDISGKIYLGSNNLDLRSFNDNLLIHNGGLHVGDGPITASSDISSSSDIYAAKIKPTKIELEVTSTTDGDANGDIVYFGGTTSMDVGQIYNLNSAGGWTKAQANSQANSDALLAVALGAASDTNGMLLKGMVTLDHDPGTIGDPLYLSDGTAGQATSTAPNSTNDIVRLIGYCVGSTSGQIYFNPSNDFIKHA